jgi:hypothetical protein
MVTCNSKLGLQQALLHVIVMDLINAWLDDSTVNTFWFNRVPTIHIHCHAMAQ